MKENRSAISKAGSYEEIGAFWDTHDLSRYWDKTKPVEFEVNILSEETYYALDNELLIKVQKVAQQLGTSPKMLMEKWIHEKLEEQKV